ncbi:MAG: CHAT domain-containing protein, partial [Anaerolineae bacterium]|nr:CHAT domain-containing protein [Anaerolineae bacterium]
MLELSVRFTAADDAAPLSVSLFRPDTGVAADPAPFTPPLDDPELADLRWYLEIFSTWPTGPDYQRAERIQSRLDEWGRALRTSIMAGGEDAVSLWQQFVDAPTRGKLLTIDATDPRVLRLPWELLADKGGHIFKRRISVRRRLQQPTTTSINTFKLPVRMLVIVSRPDDAGFISSRAVSQPLLDALAELGGQVEFEFLYPPTLTALTERLEAPKLPPIHIVHFDGHGVYDSLQGLGYLLFEDDEHKLDRVDADRLGTLLYDCGIPLMVLNACQSAKQDVSNPYDSVAARLIRAGVGSVLAMNYSVLVTAARKFVTAFYGGLATGLTVGQAVDKGRTRLLADEKRHTISRRNDKGDLVEETIRLRDWFLPALYQQAADPVVFSPDSPSPEVGEPGPGGEGWPAALTTPTAPGGLPADPRHGFHGRSREMLHLERALAEHAVIVLHGFGGL